MAQTTEAACLLQSGAMYPRRLGLKTLSGDDLFVGVKPGGVAIYFGDAPIYHFDLDGRWQRAFVDGVHYLKGLDATVRSIDREREGVSMVLRRNTLPFGRAVDLDASIRSAALDLIDDLDSNRLEILETPDKARPFTPEEFRSFLERVAGWDSTAWFAHRERYLGSYGPIPFLPPDSLNALILQVTLGDAKGRAFGRAQASRHYVRSIPEFEGHLRTVSKLVGRRISQHNSIFLAGADVLHLPTPDLLRYFEVINRHFGGEDPARPPLENWDDVRSALRQIHVFLDDLRSPLPDRDAWSELFNANLTRVTIGVESIDPSLSSTYKTVISEIHQAGIGIGLVLLIGAGGGSGVEVASSTSFLETLPFWSSDLITLLDARGFGQSPESEDAPLTDEEFASQVSVFKSWSKAGGPSKRPKVVVYNPEKQSI